MMKYTLTLIFTLSTIPTAFAGATSPGIYFVSPGTLNVRLAAGKNGKRIKKLSRQQEVEVLEIKDDWARISTYYDGAADGVSGEVAHWVAAQYLHSNLPVKTNTVQTQTVSKKIAKPNLKVAMAIKLSDDFSKHHQTFVAASEKLINNGSCKLEDFKKLGGWWQSLKHKPEPVYVTYCGGTTDSYRIYLNAKTGTTFK